MTSSKGSSAEVLGLIDMLASHEEAIRTLYELFGEKVPAQRDFWRRLAAEEAGHCRLLKRLRSVAEAEHLALVDARGLTSNLLRAIEQTGARIEDVNQNGISAVRALAMSQEIEASMIEGHLFEAFETVSPQASTILNELRSVTEIHSHRIDDFAGRRSRYQGLVDRGAITAAQLETAQRVAQNDGVPVESVLLGAYGVSREAMLASLGEFYGIPGHDVSELATLPPELGERVARRIDQLRAARCVPVALNGRKVVVAMADPKDIVARDHLRGLFDGHIVDARVAIAEDISATLDRLAGIEPSEKRIDSISAQDLASMEDADEDVADLEDDSEVARLVNRLIEEAHARGASDVHIEPSIQGDGLVRYRIDGVLHKAEGMGRALRKAVISRIKIMSDLDISERRKPQSGKIRFRRWGKLDLDVRVETFPTASGAEDAVLRLLVSAQAKPLEQLGLSQRNMREINKLVHAPYGIMLCVGPTGSGKTTTLHSALSVINREDIKILTAEDPVEIAQPGMRQVQINPKAGVTFASALRSFLRADPDVIMIGEMRDAETAGIAVEASLTGHLVFSTLHTNSAPETITRLLDMGLDPYSFSDALLGVLAQRLVRTICGQCREPHKLTGEAFVALRQEYGQAELFDALGVSVGHQVARPKAGGCGACSGLGYRGRMAVHELLVATDEIKAMICSHASVADIRNLAVKQGMRTLKQDGIEKFLAGHTTMEEVRAVCSR